MSSKDRPEHVLDASFLNFSLDKALDQIKSEAQWISENRNSITLVKNAHSCIMLMAFHKDAVMPEHSTTNPISLLVLSGQIKFSAKGLVQILNTHDLITLDKNIPHEVTALEESAALLTLSYT